MGYLEDGGGLHELERLLDGGVDALVARAELCGGGAVEPLRLCSMRVDGRTPGDGEIGRMRSGGSGARKG